MNYTFYTVISNISFILIILALYAMVMILKRIEDKGKNILTVEEYEHIVVWKNNSLRKINPPEKLKEIIERVSRGDIVKIENKRVYNYILKISNKTVEFNNLILVNSKKK